MRNYIKIDAVPSNIIIASMYVNCNYTEPSRTEKDDYRLKSPIEKVTSKSGMKSRNSNANDLYFLAINSELSTFFNINDYKKKLTFERGYLVA